VDGDGEVLGSRGKTVDGEGVLGRSGKTVDGEGMHGTITDVAAVGIQWKGGSEDDNEDDNAQPRLWLQCATTVDVTMCSHGCGYNAQQRLMLQCAATVVVITRNSGCCYNVQPRLWLQRATTVVVTMFYNGCVYYK